MTKRNKRRRRARTGWRAITTDPRSFELAQRVSSDLDEYVLEVCGQTEPDGMSILVGSVVWSELLARVGPDATWADLQIDWVLDQIPAGAAPDAHIYLRALVTWLHHNGRLGRSAAVHALDRLDQREPPSVAAMRDQLVKHHTDVLHHLERQRLRRRAARRRHTN